MASAIYTANSSSQLTTVATTDKVRIATTTSAIAIAVGKIIPANTVDNNFLVGQGNYIAYINVAGSAGAFSISTLGANHSNTGTE